MIGYVIKRDGSVPFDAGIHPDHRAHILGHLADMGHQVQVAGDGTVKLANFSPKRHAELEKVHQMRLAKGDKA